jgi:hypothetical protein
MKWLAASILAAALLAGCSDDSTGTRDSAPPDIGVDTGQPDLPGPDSARADAAQPDAARPDAAQPDAARPDAAQPDAAQPDVAVPDTAPAVDAGYLACQKVISLCSGSSTWKGYISPFSLAQCNSVVACVHTFYSGTCLTTFKSLVSCMATISASSQCDTKCASDMSYLQTYCSCPKSCGVPCP